MPLIEVLKKKVPLWDFIQNMSQALSKCLSMCIKVDKWDYLINPSHELKNSFCLGFLWIRDDESLNRLEGKTGKGPIFKIQSDRIKVWNKDGRRCSCFVSSLVWQTRPILLRVFASHAQHFSPFSWNFPSFLMIFYTNQCSGGDLINLLTTFIEVYKLAESKFLKYFLTKSRISI